MTWVLDLDGVVWLAGGAVPGSPEAIARLRAGGTRVVFLTNNSGPEVAGHLHALGAIGIPTDAADVVTSAQAAASLLARGSTAAVVGGPGILEALDSAGVRVVAPGDRPDAVVVGRSVDLDYDQLAAAATAVRQGARFVATNADPTYPTPDGPLPGAGALVAFVATAAGRNPEVAGKPHQAVVDLVRARVGVPTIMVGDRADTDGAFAHAIGCDFGLVLSGSTSRDDLPVAPAPAAVADDLAALVAERLGPPAS